MFEIVLNIKVMFKLRKGTLETVQNIFVNEIFVVIKQQITP